MELHQLSNLAMMVMHLPVDSIRLDKAFLSPETKMWTDGQKNGQKTDKRTEKQTNKLTELHRFREEPSYDGDICPCQV